MFLFKKINKILLSNYFSHQFYNSSLLFQLNIYMIQYKTLKPVFSNPSINTPQIFKPNEFRKNSEHTVSHNNTFIYNLSPIKLQKSGSQLENQIYQSPLQFKKQKNISKVSEKSSKDILDVKYKPNLKNTSKSQLSFLKNNTNFSSNQTNPSSDNIQSTNSEPFNPFCIKANYPIQRIKSNNQKVSIKISSDLGKTFQTVTSPMKVKMKEMLNIKPQILNRSIMKKQSHEFYISHQNIKVRKNSQNTSQMQLFQILNPQKNNNKLSTKQKVHIPSSNPSFIHQNTDLLKQSLIMPPVSPKKSTWSTFALQEKSFDESQTDLNKTVNTSIQMKLSVIAHKKSTFIPFRQLKVPQNVQISHFELSKIIGNGKFGEVYMARHKKTNFLVALKKISKQKIKQFKMEKQIIEEIKLQYSVNHPNIVNLYGFFSDQQFIYIILQYVPEGTLFSELQKKEKYSQQEVANMLRSIVPAIQYLHDRQIAHRDIKPENILLSNKVLKLCDFGWAGRVITLRKTYCGTLDYAPPEILQRKQYGMSVDIWCLGILIFELLTGKVPFEHKERIQSIKRIINVDKQKIVYPSELSTDSKNLIESLLKKNPEQRLKIYQILNHPFFK